MSNCPADIQIKYPIVLYSQMTKRIMQIIIAIITAITTIVMAIIEEFK